MSKTEKISATNLKNLVYTILKNFNDDVVKNKKFTELPNCVECNKKIFASPNKAFTVLLCDHTYHRICIEKKLLLTKQQTCPFLDCGKSIEILEEFTTVETEPRRDSESSTSSIVGKMGKQLNIQSQEIIDEEMTDADNGENKDNDSKDKGVGSQKRSIEVSSKETNTKKPPSKKIKKANEKNESKLLNKLIDELIGSFPGDSETFSSASTTVTPLDMEKLKTLIPLYQNIINAELDNEKTSREVLRSYYAFGLFLSKQYEHYRKSNPEHTAQARVNDDIKKQLGEKVTETTLWKRTERAKKIYAIFSEAGEDKIQKVKSLTANAISKLPWVSIDYIVINISKKKQSTS
ncbi:hypothetical protein Glove_139g155 [Diversispora epigaea]|uniref:RING-type domain-containing protein n=1 Tax=Diversispora epigaea TaxID=1348612 RepID=A0A397IVK1_9GLOM|nr:hypothetical protein Glove_139g155 [Diversispora epigaea]